MRQIDLQANTAFASAAVGEAYWIGIIGPHWRYDEKEDDQGPRPLMTRLHTTISHGWPISWLTCRNGQGNI